MIRKTIKFFILTFIVCCVFFVEKNNVSAGEMNLHAVYVGRGDALLINSGDHYMLIDSGTTKGAPLLMNYLKKLNIPDKKIDYLVSTHPDGDHVGGFESVFKEYKVGQVIYSPCTKKSDSYSKFINSVKKLDIPFNVAVEGDSWTLGDAKITIVYDGFKGSTYNECSIVLKATCDGKTFLLMGDLPSTMERQLMDAGYNFKADVIKIGHHGAAASSCAKFLDAVSPQYAVISSSKSEIATLPKASTLMRLARRFIKTYRTTDGDVLIRCKDGNITTNNKENNGYISIKKGTITLSNNVFYDNGKERKPKVTLTVNGAVVPSSHYKVKYYSNKHTGFATVKLVATEVKYVSTCSTTFMILPAKEKLTGKVKKQNKIKLTWIGQKNATGYTIKYSTNKKFKKNVIYLNIRNPKSSCRTIAKLKYNKKYYFKIRAYKSNIGNGKWSKTFALNTGKEVKQPKEKVKDKKSKTKTKVKKSMAKDKKKQTKKSKANSKKSKTKQSKVKK